MQGNVVTTKKNEEALLIWMDLVADCIFQGGCNKISHTTFFLQCDTDTLPLNLYDPVTRTELTLSM